MILEYIGFPTGKNSYRQYQNGKNCPNYLLLIIHQKFLKFIRLSRGTHIACGLANCLIKTKN
jgi:hypothetical protein